MRANTITANPIVPPVTVRPGRRTEVRDPYDGLRPWSAITHGVGMYLKNGHVTIRTEYDPENSLGIIRIIDNGAGLKQEELEQVRREMKQSKHPEQKLGLSNVYARLRIYFHGSADIEITSIPNVETKISIFLPFTQKTPVSTKKGL